MESNDVVLGAEAMADTLRFLCMLLAGFGIACLVVILILIFKNRQRERLVDPRKENCYKKRNAQTTNENA